MNPQTVLNVEGLVTAGALAFLWRRELFRLAERIKRAHVGRAAAVPHPLPAPVNGGSTVKEETLDHKASVAALLGGAAGAAEAMTDCGIDCDETELVSAFITGMDECRAMYVDIAGRVVANDPTQNAHDSANHAMQVSPAWTNPWFLWRLASAFKNMASRDVVEAAREVTAAHGKWLKAPAGKAMNEEQAVSRAMAKLAAALPKER